MSNEATIKLLRDIDASGALCGNPLEHRLKTLIAEADRPRDGTRLSNCKLCGSEVFLRVTSPDESMHSGWASAHCRCGNSMRLEPRDMNVSGAGMTGWEWNGIALRAATVEVARRWNRLNEAAHG
jgi:hypothetical protein